MYPIYDFLGLSVGFVNERLGCDNIDQEVQKIIKYLDHNPYAELISLGIKKPSSTWTYIINDFPFGNQPGQMLINSSNIGFQVDFISLTALFFYRIFRKKNSL